MTGQAQILLATNKRDITTDFVVLELQRLGIPFLRLNTEDLPHNAVTFSPEAIDNWHLKTASREYRLSDFTAGYYRRPGDPEPLESVTDQTAREHCLSEWSAVLRSVWNALDGRWLNSPFAFLRAEDKPRQLALASQVGFNLPETLVTSSPVDAKRFAEGGNVIGKPLRQALLVRGETGDVIFTSRLAAVDFEYASAMALAPCILQREIAKECDVRVTVVGKRTFAAEIWSQENEDTTVDWRRGSNPHLRHEAFELPLALQQQCVALTELLDLSFGAIDFIRDRLGTYWFLEINPNGQWAWIEKRTGLPIAGAIVNRLVEMGS